MRRLSIIFAALLLPLSVFAVDGNPSYFKNLDKNVADVSAYSGLNKTSNYSFGQIDKEAMVNMYSADTPIVREFYRKAGVSEEDMNKFFAFVKNGGKYEKSTTLFYLTSDSVPKSNLRNFIIGFEKLRKKNPELKGYFVFNGFIKKPGGMNAFLDDLNIEDTEVAAKILPFMFERLKMEKVPAFVISECPVVKFKQSECEHKIIATGAFPFEKFLDIVNEKSDNPKYKKFYYDLIDPN